MYLLIHVFVIAQFSVCTIYSLKVISATIFALIETFGLVLQFIYQNTILDEIFPPKGNWLEVAGIVMCITGVIVGPICNLVDKWKSANKESEPTETMDVK